MKPLHAGWLIDVYNQLSLSDGKQIILSGWKAAGISDALEKGLAGFSGEFMDPFNDRSICSRRNQIQYNVRV